MCDVCHVRANWKGWHPIPGPRLTTPVGPWIDLSHALSEELERISLVPPPTFRRVTSLPKDHANATEINMVVHIGTHVDTPIHFIADGPAAEAVPLERLYGPGVVWKIDGLKPLQLIEPSHLEAATPKMQPGDIVIIDTGWAKHINTPMYEEHPSLSEPSAEWLLAHGAKLVAVDFSTPDLTVHIRPKDFTWPVHQTLLSRGVLIAEHVTNLGALAGRQVEAMFLGLNIKGSDGMPARALARAVV
jgi:kynurenine formamidase